MRRPGRWGHPEQPLETHPVIETAPGVEGQVEVVEGPQVAVGREGAVAECDDALLLCRELRDSYAVAAEKLVLYLDGMRGWEGRELRVERER